MERQADSLFPAVEPDLSGTGRRDSFSIEF